jgi:hypothetical protein
MLYQYAGKCNKTSTLEAATVTIRYFQSESQERNNEEMTCKFMVVRSDTYNEGTDHLCLSLAVMDSGPNKFDERCPERLWIFGIGVVSWWLLPCGCKASWAKSTSRGGLDAARAQA